MRELNVNETIRHHHEMINYKKCLKYSVRTTYHNVARLQPSHEVKGYSALLSFPSCGFFRQFQILTDGCDVPWTQKDKTSSSCHDGKHRDEEHTI